MVSEKRESLKGLLLPGEKESIKEEIRLTLKVFKAGLKTLISTSFGLIRKKQLKHFSFYSFVLRI